MENLNLTVGVTGNLNGTIKLYKVHKVEHYKYLAYSLTPGKNYFIANTASRYLHTRVVIIVVGVVVLMLSHKFILLRTARIPGIQRDIL